MTKIEWASLGLPKGVTWNPIRARNVKTGKTGWHCEKVSPTCEHCYAERFNMKPGATGGTGLPYKPGHRKNGDIEIYLDEKTLLAPLKWRAPRGVFPCSMTDIFGLWVTDEWLDRIFAVAILSPHRFAFLTKRCDRQRAYMSDPETPKRVWAEVDKLVELWDSGDAGFKLRCIEDDPKLFALAAQGATWGGDLPWPPKNTWHGGTVEDQPRADERIPELLATPAAVRFVSIEPMLGAIDLEGAGAFGSYTVRLPNAPPPANVEPARDDEKLFDAVKRFGGHIEEHPGVDFVITGGESGRDARGTPAALFRSIRDQCAAAGVAYHHKQNGEWIDADELWRIMRSMGAVLYHGGKVFEPETPLNYEAAVHVAKAAGAKRIEHQSDGSTLIRVGKSRAGRLLDGKTHDEFPEAR